MTKLIYDAVLFDLDGVLTSTAALHAQCWKLTFDPVLAHHGQEPFDADRDYLDHVDGKLRETGVRTAVASSSADADAVLYAAGISDHFDLNIDGSDVTPLGLAGKPAPDGFLEAARRLGATPRRSVVVGDLGELVL